jgi:hypothetical protein
MQDVLDALRDAEPESALRNVVRELLMAGRTRADVAQSLEDARGRLTDEQETEDEMLLDLIGILTGWASHTAQRNLLPPPCKTPASSLAVPS